MHITFVGPRGITSELTLLHETSMKVFSHALKFWVTLIFFSITHICNLGRVAYVCWWACACFGIILLITLILQALKKNLSSKKNLYCSISTIPLHVGLLTPLAKHNWNLAQGYICAHDGRTIAQCLFLTFIRYPKLYILFGLAFRVATTYISKF